jgi:hypothetical protein
MWSTQEARGTSRKGFHLYTRINERQLALSCLRSIKDPMNNATLTCTMPATFHAGTPSTAHSQVLVYLGWVCDFDA